MKNEWLQAKYSLWEFEIAAGLRARYKRCTECGCGFDVLTLSKSRRNHAKCSECMKINDLKRYERLAADLDYREKRRQYMRRRYRENASVRERGRERERDPNYREKRRQYMRHYYRENASLQREKAKAYRARKPGMNAIWRKNHPEYDIHRALERKMLSDGYIRDLIKDSDLWCADVIPEELIAAKREEIKLKRLLKERKNESIGQI